MARFAEFLARLRGGGEPRDRERLSAILGLNRQLAKAADRRQVLTLLVDEAVRLFGAERGFLCVRQAEGEDGLESSAFSVEVARNLDGESVRSPLRKLSKTIVNQALAGEGLFSPDAQQGGLGAAQSIADLNLRSVLAMPLVAGGAVLGCIYLDHRFHKGAFTEQDLPWLQAFADQAAIVLHLHGLLGVVAAQADQLREQNRALSVKVACQAEELSGLQPEITRADLLHEFREIVGDSAALLRALAILDRVVDADLSVLLTGESGTGKELAARALHDEGPRHEGPFVAVNTAAIAPALLESELFGHVRGAFTGADRDRLGLIRQAEGGTLFLDEITEMSLDLQAGLLRVLEQRQVRPVGGDRAYVVDVRVVAATNTDPRTAIEQDRLRQDLYYRLAVVTVRLPALRERLADIEPLARHLLLRLAASRGEPTRDLPEELLSSLRRRAWPGNVRELSNVLQQLDAMAADGPLPAVSPAPTLEIAGADGPPAEFDLGVVERWAIARALRATGGNKAEAARLLGIARRTLYARLAEMAANPGS